MLKQFPLKLGEACAATWLDILNLDINDGGPVIAITWLWMLAGKFALSLAAFMPGLNSMSAARGVSSCKYAWSYEKVEVVDLIFNGLILKISTNYLGALSQLVESRR